jgi:hypothetical protein
VNSTVPSGKCPQKMMVKAQTLRTTFAVMLAASVDRKSGPVRAGHRT